jgi:hypothetical protein
MERTIEAMVAGRWRWLEKMRQAKARGLINKIPTGRRRPGVSRAPSKMMAQARGIAWEAVGARPEPAKRPEEMDHAELANLVFWESLAALGRILDDPDVRLARLQGRIALYLAKVYFR